MAVCEICKLDMLVAPSCNLHMLMEVATLRYTEQSRASDGRIYTHFCKPIPNNEKERCHDCGVQPNGYHHRGCDNETCPKCGGKLMSCGCFDRTEDDPVDAGSVGENQFGYDNEGVSLG